MHELTLGVVIPCFNEDRTIKEILSRVLAQNAVHQVVIIDDCSSDQSAEIIQSFEDTRITYFKNSQNMGKGASIAKGIDFLTTDIMLIQDADLEYSPEEYAQIIKPILDGRADVVFGSRFFAHGERRALYFRHRIGNELLTFLSNLFTNLDITDMETCYKAMKTKHARILDIKEKRFGIEPEITAKIAAMQLSVYEVPISYSGRTYDEGKKITWRDGIRAVYVIVKYNSRRQRKAQFSKFKKHNYMDGQSN